jgi:hypothetical protein
MLTKDDRELIRSVGIVPIGRDPDRDRRIRDAWRGKAE